MAFVNISLINAQECLFIGNLLFAWHFAHIISFNSDMQMLGYLIFLPLFHL